ncbi:hypothetical protein INS49_007368 [Diaporthe citri]|uniref:uncharacterized protein n=1 Tax=Diaporthe citri TaxID=83186 RepID=UPI001C81F59C|nr:uncharacterized protein INS49_007368 [Diaporthe citri]KAG6365757.1 hypothetical protein INS49_007368 [Diaporthe citri]
MYVIGKGTGANITISQPVSEFDKSADQGCPICWVIASIGRLDDDLIDPGMRLSVWFDAYGNSRVLCGGRLLHIYIPEGNPSRAPDQWTPALGSIQVKADISPTAWSESAQKSVQACIRRCTQDHDRCKLGETLLPARVLEVRNVGDGKLRLLETQNSSSGQYTALRYCWDSDQPLKTTSTNIKDMMTTGVQLSELPPTLVDAVHVTRLLGIRYLWIDALCIVQDNVEDWERQSEQMSTIYEKAYLVIAASSSSSATQGFLNHQREQHPYYLRLPDRYGTQATVAAQLIPESGIHTRSQKTDPWTMDELQWVCKTEKDCECRLPAASNSYHSMLRGYCDGTHQDQVASTELTLRAGHEWCKAVSDYSRRRLTRADDKLPGIPGIASRFAAGMGFRYVAGLWAEDIIQGLAWRRDSSNQLGTEELIQ